MHGIQDQGNIYKDLEMIPSAESNAYPEEILFKFGLMSLQVAMNRPTGSQGPLVHSAAAAAYRFLVMHLPIHMSALRLRGDEA